MLELFINQDKWNALNDEQQTVLDTACRAMLLTTLAEGPRLQAAALDDLVKEGVRIETWSNEMIEAFHSAWDDVAKEEGDRDPVFKRVLDDLGEIPRPETYRRRHRQHPKARRVHSRPRQDREWSRSSY